MHTKEIDREMTRSISLVRAARIELASFAWKADILAIIRRPQTLGSIAEMWDTISIRKTYGKFESISQQGTNGRRHGTY